MKINRIITQGLIDKLEWEKTGMTYQDQDVYKDADGNRYMLKELSPEVYKIMVRYSVNPDK